jgi:hypothetical protein
MTLQEIFDYVSNKMRLNGLRGNDSGKPNTWGYINYENPCQRCAKGFLMNVNHVREVFRTGGNFSWVKEVEYGIGQVLDVPMINLLNALEYIFEHAKDEDLEENLELTAKVHNLEYRPYKVNYAESDTGAPAEKEGTFLNVLEIQA